MPATGVYLRRYLGAEAQAKSIVLVGSKIPLGEAGSDAPAALEFAISTLREEVVGVWIAMNGRTWHPAEVVKDRISGDYIALDAAPVD
jgi:L-asparaginase/Glu-tRNA(Gln) amidotransferase subunit D